MKEVIVMDTIKRKKEYPAKEAARILGITPQTMYRYVKEGLIQARIEPRLKQTRYYISEEEIQRIQKIFQEKKKQ